MAFFDLSEDQLRAYTGQATLPVDFEAFWQATLDEQVLGDPAVEYAELDGPVTAYRVFEMSFCGYGGTRVNTWVRVPTTAAGPLATVVNFIGYSGSRGYPWKDSHFVQAGYVHVMVDSRGQGWNTRQFSDSTPDPDPSRGEMSAPGMMTSGVLDRDTYYYRRLYIDAIRSVQAVRTLPWVDPHRLVVAGASQGGGLTLAAAGLAEMAGIELAGTLVDVPFLCDFPRAVGLTDAYPYREIVDYLRNNPQYTDQVFNTLSYFDGVNFARRIHAPGLFSTALMDQVCPPSTVFAAYNNYPSPDKDIRVWRWNGHEGGQEHMIMEQLHWLSSHFVDR